MKTYTAPPDLEIIYLDVESGIMTVSVNYGSSGAAGANPGETYYGSF